ncbi:MAG: cyclase family protein [Planctomycetaceae bacterium]|nr:cyclase family protein [Planctomycetaceae bacterium]
MIRFIPACLVLVAAAARADDSGAGALTLNDVAAGRADIVDLSYSLDARTNFWPGEKYEPFTLETIATLEKDGVLSKTMRLPEHIGTHIDAPNHFERDQPGVDQIAPRDLIGPGVVIDITPQAETDADYGLTIDDIAAWEQEHGRIPKGAIVLLRTGWGRFWSMPERFQGRDALGGLHFPAYTGEAARLLIHERGVRGLGVDTLSIDRGVSKTFEVHHIVNAAGRYGLENVAALERLPPRGVTLIVAPMKIESGTGGPTRIFAVLPQR